MSGACAIAWSSSANLGPGFDSLALAHDAYYDVACVKVERGGEGVRAELLGPWASHVSRPTTAEVAVSEALSRTGLRASVTVRLYKGVPVSAGLGGSAASAVAALRALEWALDLAMSPAELVEIAGLSERVSAGSPHYDNAAASALGGLVVVSRGPRGLSLRSYRVSLRLAVLRPLVKPMPMKTKIMREVLPGAVSLGDHVADLSRALSLLSALIDGDLEAAGASMDDVIVTPARAKLVPCFNEVRASLLSAGAYGVAISGAGPSIIALGPGESLESIVRAGLGAYRSCGLEAEGKVASAAPASAVVEGERLRDAIEALANGSPYDYDWRVARAA